MKIPKFEGPRVKGQIAAGAAFAVVIAWGWNEAFPEALMPGEVGAALGAIVGPVVAYLVSWLPMPGE